MARKRVLINVEGGTPGALHMIHGHLLKVSHVLFSHKMKKEKNQIIIKAIYIYIRNISFIWMI
jgi:hypothetical protein